MSLRPELIKLSYTDTDPRRCFEIAKKLAAIYVRESMIGKERESREAFDFIDKQVKEYGAELADAHRKVLAYYGRQDHPQDASGPQRADDRAPRPQKPRLSPEELAALRAEEGTLVAELASEARQGKQRRAERTLQLQRELDTLLTSLTDNHPSVKRVRDELRINREESAKAGALEEQATRSARLRLEQVRKQLASAPDASRRPPRAALQPPAPELRGVGQDSTLAELVRRYEATNDVYQDLLKRRENARVSMELDNQHRGVALRIYEAPELPVLATGPRLMQVTIIGLVLAVLAPLGLLAAFVRFDPRIRSAQQNRAGGVRAAPHLHPLRADAARPVAPPAAHGARGRDGRGRVRHLRGVLRDQAQAGVMSHRGESGKGAPEGGDVPGGGEARAEGIVSLKPMSKEAHDYLVRGEGSRALGAPIAAAPPAGVVTNEQLESFRELRTRLVLMAEGVGLEHFTTMVVPMTGDSGASFVARNLAAAFTLQERPALLIECDFKHATQHEALGPGGDAEGLYDYLADADNPSAVLPIWPTVVPGLHLIPAGRCQTASPGPQREYLSSRPMKELMTKLRSWPCYLFLDAPPAKGSPDARILSDLADFIVLVVGYGRTTNHAIAQTAAMSIPRSSRASCSTSTPRSALRRARADHGATRVTPLDVATQEPPEAPGRIGGETAPRRVLYVVSLFPCWSETFIVREIETLIALGADVRILSLKAPYEKIVHPEAERLLPRVRHPLPAWSAALARARAFVAHPIALSSIVARVLTRLASRPADLAKSLAALARGVEHLAWIREFDPDLIHAHWATYPSTVAWALAKALRKPFGFTCHAHDIFVNDHLVKEKIEAADVPVTISRYNVEWLAKHRTPSARGRLHVVHCGVNLATIAFRAGGREPGLILAVGRLDATKGFDVLIDAVGALHRQGRRVRCRIVGEGPLEPSLRAAIARHRLTDLVELTGALPQGAVRESLRAASIFALPSVITESGNRDGIPVALMEAMAAGTPAVSTRVSGIPELIEDGAEGLLVPERDSRALAAALARLLDDPELGAQLAVAARAKIERQFDAALEAHKLLDLFAHARAGR